GGFEQVHNSTSQAQIQKWAIVPKFFRFRPVPIALRPEVELSWKKWYGMVP
ncbi:unnamed protein product, partial [Haemonchus placei]|uniref:Pyridoxamine 5'-phosphate oxidase n=1 Tax=Haemonchus placei TaxID=6290 RepID=A0A0N4X0S1_HAEPC